MLAQNGWFVLRSVLPAGKTGKVLTWIVEPHAIPNWIREPNIGFSQVGYQPDQPKVAVIELDKNDTPLKQASLMCIKEDGTSAEVFRGDIKEWGTYFKYNYVKNNKLLVIFKKNMAIIIKIKNFSKKGCKPIPFCV